MALDYDEGVVNPYFAECNEEDNQQIVLRTNGNITTANHVKYLVLDMGINFLFEDCVAFGNKTFEISFVDFLEHQTIDILKKHPSTNLSSLMMFLLELCQKYFLLKNLLVK